MSENNQEIPGFYRDPVTGKYYADKPGVSCNPALKKLKTERLKSGELKVTPMITNIVRYLNAREMRGVGGVQESKENLKMRWYLKQRIQSREINELSFPSVDVDYIKASSHSIYGYWKDEKHNVNVIGTMKLKVDCTSDSYFHMVEGRIIDMCEGFGNDYIVVYSPSYLHDLLAQRIEGHSRVTMLSCIARPYSGRSSLDKFDRQLFCCCCNKQNSYYAFGSDYSVICMDTENRESFHKVNGRVHTISFDDTGNVMASGVHTGSLILNDLRTKRIAMNIRVSKSCLIDSSFINTDHIIVAGANDVLCKVDIRKKEVVTEFLSHKQQNIRKAPVSIASHMLCAAGSDNIIRIWDLSGGLPVHEMKPFDNPQNKMRGWLSNADNVTNLHCFENINRKVFQII